MTERAMTVGHVMTRSPVSVPAGAPFARVANVLSRRRISAVPVVDRDGRLIGVVSRTDLVGGRDGAGVTARELMSTSVRTVPVDATLSAATRLLAGSGVRRLFVLDRGRLVGVLSRRDLLTGYLALVARPRTFTMSRPAHDAPGRLAGTTEYNQYARRPGTPPSHAVDPPIHGQRSEPSH